MKKTISCILMLAALVALGSCGKKEAKGSDTSDMFATELSEDDAVKERTANLTFLSSMPIEGEDAEYFSATGQDGTETVTITGTPGESQSTIRATVKINVNKHFDNLKGYSVFPPLTLNFLNGDKNELEGVSRLELSDADKDALLAELKKDNPGVVEVSYMGEFYGSDYNKIFDEAKYVQITGAELSENEPDLSVDTSDYEDAYNSAVKDYQDAYNSAVREYQNAYNDAKRKMGL